MYFCPGALRGMKLHLSPVGKAGAAAPAQAGLLHRLDDLVLRDALGEHLAPGLVAAGLQIVLVAPRLLEVERREADVVFLRDRADCHGYSKPSRIRSTFSVVSCSW
jgi:hypothetical protein